MNQNLTISISDADNELLKTLSDFSYEELKNLHRQLFEIDDRQSNADLIYRNEPDRVGVFSELGLLFDRLEMCINRRLIQGVVNRG